MTSSEFDWRMDGDDADSVVLWEQPATAVYQNPKGCVVIRQERSWDEREDVFVFVTPENVSAVVTAMTAVAETLRRDRKTRTEKPGQLRLPPPRTANGKREADLLAVGDEGHRR